MSERESIKSIKSLLSQLEFSTWALSQFATNFSLFPGTIISLSLFLAYVHRESNPPVRISYIVTYLWYALLEFNLPLKKGITVTMETLAIIVNSFFAFPFLCY
jgi:hypothetical protein